MSFFRSTPRICFYDMHYATVPQTTVFPHATTVAILRCGPQIIPSLLTPERFPRLQTIHYLSGHPGTHDLHLRFSGVKWVFPVSPRTHSFYQFMTEAGYGIYDASLLSSYVHSSVYYRGHCNRMEFDLHLPGLFPMSGKAYRMLLYRYLFQNKDCPMSWSVSVPPRSPSHPMQFYLHQKKEEEFFQCIFSEEELSIPPVATPFHSSSR